ncbi:glucose-6-phosphate isomerase family protein, partial [Salmonella enterica]|uniref:glucose-6-phosphate isomerase family protein n=1 Tax=Salmonella enterica TaxID=28901 RepID=UPI00398C37F8
MELESDGERGGKVRLEEDGCRRESDGQKAVEVAEFGEGVRNEPAYGVYGGLRGEEDQERVAADQYQYDNAIIMPGTIGKESKKTSGHYHDYNDTRRNTHQEVYEVIKGTAAYILKKSPDFAAAPQELVVDD